MKAPPAVVTVAYGQPDLLRRALEPLADFNVVVVDNGSSDEVRNIARDIGATYRRPLTNLGFAAGVNVALREVPPGQDVLLLNPDAVIEPLAVLALQAELRRVPRTAAAAPSLLRADGSRERTEWPLPRPVAPWLGAAGLDDRLSRGPRFLNGAVLLLAAQAMAEIGPFDERYFLYAEEADWQKRAADAGWSLRFASNVEALHVGAATSSDPELRDRLFHGSAAMFIDKWYGRTGLLIFRAGSVVAAARRMLTARDRAARASAWRAGRCALIGPGRSIPAFARRAR